MTRPLALTADDIADIARLLPERSLYFVAQYLGCDRRTVIYHANKLGVERKVRSRGGRPAKRLVGPETGEKRCTACQQTKPLSEFYRNCQGIMGRATRCIPCDRGARA